MPQTSGAESGGEESGPPVRYNFSFKMVSECFGNV